METREKHDIREAPKGLGGLLRNIGPGIVVSGFSGRVWGTFGDHDHGRQSRICVPLGRHRRLPGEVLHPIGTGAAVRPAQQYDHPGTGPGAWTASAEYLLGGLAVRARVFLGMIAVIGILGSVAGLMVTLLPGISYAIWAFVIFLAMSFLLYRGLYQDLEKMVLLLVTSFSLVVIGSVLLLQGTTYAISGENLLSGFRFAMPAEGAFVAMAVMGSVGATAVELFMYPYWIREKGYPDFVGPQEDTPEWQERYRGWMRVLFTDALVCTLIATVITCAYYLLGASILKQLNVLPQGMKVVEQVSLIFTKTLGAWAYYLFMFGGFCTLFSTLLVFTASSGRIGVDFLRQVGVSSLNREEVRRRLTRILQIAFPFIWLCVTLMKSDTPLALVLIGANANNLLLIPMAYGVVHLAMRTVGRVRMPLWVELGLLFTIWVIVNFTAINLYLTWTQ